MSKAQTTYMFSLGMMFYSGHTIGGLASKHTWPMEPDARGFLSIQEHRAASGMPKDDSMLCSVKLQLHET